MNLISQVQAQETQGIAQAPQEGFSISSFIPLILIFAIFYILIIRPQNKKIKEHKELVDGVKKGDKVTTSSGIIGVVKNVDSENNIVDLEISEDVVIQVLKNSISQVMDTKKSKDKKVKKGKK